MSAPRTNMAGSRSPPPPTGSGSATRSGCCRGIATRPSIFTTGMSASAAIASRRCGRLPPRQRTLGAIPRRRMPHLRSLSLLPWKWGRQASIRIVLARTPAAPTSPLRGRAAEAQMATAQASRQRRDLWDNPMGTDGFEFIEYTGPDPSALAALFERMGFVAAARHRSKNVTLYQQGDINFILNAEPESFAQAFARL